MSTQVQDTQAHPSVDHIDGVIMTATETTTTETLRSQPVRPPRVYCGRTRRLRRRCAHPVAAHYQLTARDQPNHANLGRTIAGAGCTRTESVRRRLECRHRRRPSGVCHVLPEQPGAVRTARRHTAQYRLPLVLPEQPDPVYGAETQPIPGSDLHVALVPDTSR